MIAVPRAQAYRRFYLYSALSLAVGAAAVALVLVLRAALQSFGVGPPTLSSDISRSVSLAVAILLFALPVGAAHLFFVRRALADQEERASDIRHQFLSLWTAAALLLELVWGVAAVNVLVYEARPDLTAHLAVIPVAGAVGLVAIWWAARTPPARILWRVRAAIVVMLIAMVVAAFLLGSAASAAGALFSAPTSFPPLGRGFDPRLFQERTLRSGIFTAIVAFTVWALAFGWQWRWPKMPDRLAYALLGYGVGVALFVIAFAYELSGIVRFAERRSEVGALTAPWAPLAAGALLVLVHGVLLFRDRGRNGHPAIVTTRMLLAIPATVGLAALIGALGVAWHAFVDREVLDPGRDLTLAAALAVVGLIYPQTWIPFVRRSPPVSAVRRFYLYDVVCLGLIATVVSGVISAYNAFIALGGAGTAESGRTALSWALPALLLGGVFAIHLRLLLRDHRAIAASAPVAVAAPDPLILMLESVRHGRLSVAAAAGELRAGPPGSR
ncbi:MAG TPA: hypothetical protein VHG53_00550 [Candidatus Limnocylindria bacterium]|nr:hypothetical protein [Candidatus Limnocylindria bacterium]